MISNHKLVPIQEALDIVLAHRPPRSLTHMSLADASGQVLAEDIHAPHDYPPFNRALLDGYALRRDEASST